MNHEQRRWILYDAVERLEPRACSAAILEDVRGRHGLDLPLIRVYVDLERLVATEYLSRHIKARPTGEGTTFYWETTSKVLVQPDRPDPRASAEAARLQYRRRHRFEVVADLHGAGLAWAILHETA